MKSSRENQVRYKPGEEPENIRKDLDLLFENLDSAYPDKIVSGLHKEHKMWGDSLTSLYKRLGYKNGNALLNAYGYRVFLNGGDKATINPDDIIDDVKKRYKDAPRCQTISELLQENHDLADDLKALQESSQELFGMTFKRYLLKEGVLTKQKERCSDIEIKPAKEGKLSDAEKLDFVTKELKKRYPDSAKFKGSLSQLYSANSDLHMSGINALISRVYNMNTKEYFVKQGIIEEDVKVKKKRVKEDSDEHSFFKEDSKSAEKKNNEPSQAIKKEVLEDLGPKGYVQNGFYGRDEIERCKKGTDQEVPYEHKRYSTSINGTEITVTFKAEGKLSDSPEEFGFANEKYYRPEDALDHLLTKEEFSAGITDKAEYFIASGWMEKTVVNEEEVIPISQSEFKERKGSFVSICRRCKEDDVLQMIVDNAEKQKNGLLKKEKNLLISAFMVIPRACTFSELVARSISETEIIVDVIDNVFFDYVEWQNATDNPIINYISQDASDKPEKKKNTGRVYIKATRLYGAGGVVHVDKFHVPVTSLENGEYALNTEPLMPLSSFKCLEGSDKEGYVFKQHFLDKREEEVLYKGEKIRVIIGPQYDDFADSIALCLLAKYFYKNRNCEEISRKLLWPMVQANYKECDKAVIRGFREKYLKKDIVPRYFLECFYLTDRCFEYCNHVDPLEILETLKRTKTGNISHQHQYYRVLDTENGKMIRKSVPLSFNDISEAFEDVNLLGSKEPFFVPIAEWKMEGNKLILKSVELFKRSKWYEDFGAK